MVQKISVDCTSGLTQTTTISGAELTAHTHTTLPEIHFAGQTSLNSQITTLDATPTILFRFPLNLLSVYGGFVDIYVVDRANGVTKSWYFKALVKRLNGGALVIGKQDLHPPIQEPAGAPATSSSVATWDYTASVSGNDALITVTGAAGRTLDWFAFVDLRWFTPGGA